MYTRYLIKSLIVLLLAHSLLLAGDDVLEQKVTVAFDNIEAARALNLFAKQYQINLIITEPIAGEVSLQLNDVPLHQVFDAILIPRGLNYTLNEGVVVVKSINKLLPHELQTELFRLSHISAEQIDSMVMGVLSPIGRVDAFEFIGDEEGIQVTPNCLLVTDNALGLSRARDLIEKLDIKQRQVMVSVKLVETNLSENAEIGVKYPDFLTGTVAGSPLTDGLVEHDFESGKTQWGILSLSQFQMTLNMLLQNGNGRLLSDPNITTIDNRPAIIEITTTIPVQTLNRFTEGAVIQDIVSFEDLDVGITLKVTPRISADDEITLEVEPRVEEITGYTGPTDNQRPITANRSLKTTVTVKNGETLAIGGLIKDSEITTTKKVPLLGDIPILGALFRNKKTEKQQTNLIIFITPQILED